MAAQTVGAHNHRRLRGGVHDPHGCGTRRCGARARAVVKQEVVGTARRACVTHTGLAVVAIAHRA